MSEISVTEFSALREDIGELRAAMTKMVEALERLARLEERQGNSARALERAFLDISKVDIKADALDIRLKNLEIAQPSNNKTSEWVERIGYGAVCVLAMFVLKKMGLV